MADENRNRIVLMTGDGKGKTTAALGMALRALGHGMQVCLIQFVKARLDTGELRALARLPVEVHVCGRGFVMPNDRASRGAHIRAAEKGLELARAKLADPVFGMVVLDEICGAVALGLLDAKEVRSAVQAASPGCVVVMTGRDACRELIDLADTVSRIECVKHGMDARWPAQRGVEM